VNETPNTADFEARDPNALTTAQTVVSWLGLPIMVGAEGDHPPIATALVCGLVFVLFVFGLIDPEGVGPTALGFVAGESSALQALVANLVHFDWVHLLGNLYFLFAFGEGLEHKVPRWVLLGAFFGLGAVSIWLDGLHAEPGVLIAGSSGGVAVVMGACLVVQPRARVLTSLAVLLSPMVMLVWLGVRFIDRKPLTPPALWLPIWVYGAFEVAFQLLMFTLDVPGVAWVAHLSGLLMGVTLGVVARKLWPQNERIRD